MGSKKKLAYSQVHAQVVGQADLERAKILQRFFKTGPGQYGADDVFCGLTVPQSRALAKKYCELNFSDIRRLLKSKIHEERLIALLILVIQYDQGDLNLRKQIYQFYLQNITRVNNWDLVDLSADKIVGRHLFGRSIAPLLKLVSAKNLWERRIAVVATFQFLKHGRFQPTLKIVKKLLTDRRDLIHKACGWMLREVGKRDAFILEKFLKNHHANMPRTMLRYAIERFGPLKRARYLRGL